MIVDTLINRFLKAEAELKPYGDEKIKDAFHRSGKAVLRRLATDLGLSPGSYDVRSNKGGVAVSGEITLHGENIYVQMEQSCMGAGMGILVRTCKGRQDYCGGRNNWWPLASLKDWPRFVETVRAVADAE